MLVTEQSDVIILQGLKENNLKNIDVTIQKKKITVFTDPSGSGKSSVVFDTLAKESQRQMTRNYPQYVRNQLQKFERPQADAIQNISPVVVVEQRPVTKNSRSTVGTYMDISPLIRLLFSRVGRPKVPAASDFLHHGSFGPCPECRGHGEVIEPDVEKLVDFHLSLREGAVKFKPLSPSGWQGRWMITGGLFNPDMPIKDYPKEKYELFLYGPPLGEKVYAPFHTKNGPQPHEWDGLLPRFKRLYIHRDITKLKQVTIDDVLQFSTESFCSTCRGSGLHPKVLACNINGLNILDYYELELSDLRLELQKITEPLGKQIAQQMIPLVEQLIGIGLGYISLSRKMGTLSGGEAQRVKIARHLVSSLNNLTYIFDEPSAGLHQEEIAMLIHMVKKLKEQHNTVVMIEHEPMLIEIADEVIAMGPKAGAQGGEIVYQGKPKLSNVHHLRMNKTPRKPQVYFIIERANQNNLQNIDVNTPKNVLVTICGVSGSEKSTLMLEEFSKRYPEAILVNQGSIGISNRSTLATYMGMMDEIRTLFARASRQPAGLFSFNSLGACTVCDGKGEIQPDVAFADPVSIPCEACGGTRYSNEALSYRYKGKTIVDFLKLTVDELIEYIDSSKMKQQIQTLQEVGLGYITLGQTTSTLSGGEVQRLKLASYLQHQGQIYVVDEPSVGLNVNDYEKLLAVFKRMVERGNSVILIEHNLDFIAASDWIIELGPGGGKNGGHMLFSGTPEEMLQANTLTAKWLRHMTVR